MRNRIRRTLLCLPAVLFLFFSNPAAAQQLITKQYDKYSQQIFWSTGMHPLAAPLVAQFNPRTPPQPMVNMLKVDFSRIDTNVYGTFRITLQEAFSIREGDKIIFALANDKVAEFIAAESKTAKLRENEKHVWIAEVEYTIARRHRNRITHHIPLSVFVEHSEDGTEFKRIRPKNADWMQDALLALDAVKP